MTGEQIKEASVSAFEGARSVASFIPAKFRAAIYSALATILLLEAIWDLVPEVLEGKVLKSLSVLGFGMAALNTGDLPSVRRDES